MDAKGNSRQATLKIITKVMCAVLMSLCRKRSPIKRKGTLRESSAVWGLTKIEMDRTTRNMSSAEQFSGGKNHSELNLQELVAVACFADVGRVFVYHHVYDFLSWHIDVQNAHKFKRERERETEMHTFGSISTYIYIYIYIYSTYVFWAAHVNIVFTNPTGELAPRSMGAKLGKYRQYSNLARRWRRGDRSNEEALQ